MSSRVLIIDDDKKLCALLGEYLGQNGFSVAFLHEGEGALQMMSRESPDIIILDIMLPGKDGLEVLRDIRRSHKQPVIMLTAKGEDTDRIVGLELGADDYLAKPFNPRELLARMKAVLRRSVSREDDGDGRPEAISISAGGIVLNRARQTVTAEGEEHTLSTAQFRILEVLMKHPKALVSRDQLMTLARGRDFTAFDRSIDVHVSKLRAKVEPDPRTPTRIRTIWGTGYMFIDSP
jgi:two-component system, OmpR family, phosphate regulon response regulator OmpR